MATGKKILKELKNYADKELAEHHKSFFKAVKGGYGEGDMFWGVKVPFQRQICRKYWKETEIRDAEELLCSEIHEVRLTALMILAAKYGKAGIKEKKQIIDVYIRNAARINNWDLVDLSAPLITGPYWFEYGDKDLWKFAKSGKLWYERISVLSTFYFIKQNRFDETLRLAEMFLTHKHDLMHKASGWMLREIGKRDLKTLYTFLDKHYKIMPRTMLRYSIEKLPYSKRKYYMER